MFQKTLLIGLAALFSGSASLMGQNSKGPSDAGNEKSKNEDASGDARFWQATLSGGHYMVALDRITSVSRHKYLLDGGLIIDEVTVDTLGQALARFYFIAPLSDEVPANSATELASRGKELLDQVGERAGIKVQNMVVKKYPDTSHAKSIEYRILSEAALTALYTSVRNAWETGRGRQFGGK